MSGGSVPPRKNSSPVEETRRWGSMTRTEKSSIEAEVVVNNVPRLQIHQVDVVKKLVADLVPNVEILTIVIGTNSWVLGMRRREDAALVMHGLSGQSFGGQILMTTMKEIDPAWSKKKLDTAKLLTPAQIWELVEWNDLQKLKRDCVTLLTQASNPTTVDSLIAQLHEMRGGSIPMALSIWPIGTFRCFAPQLLLSCGFVHLVANEHMARKSDDEPNGGSHDAWEQFSPSTISNTAQLAAYMTDFLLYFGPQHIELDIPIRLLATVMSDPMPKCTRLLAEMLTNFSSAFVLWDDVLYLVTEVRHRKELLDSFRQGDEEELTSSGSNSSHRHTQRSSKRRH